MIKEYIGFCQNGKWEVYKLNADKTWYLLPDNNTGHQVATVEKFSFQFLIGDSEQEILTQIERKKHVQKYGLGTEGDVACPNCGYKYSLDYYDCNDGYYTPGIREDFSEIIPCICGTKFKANIKAVNVIWNVEKI
jgi:hypothetical protein